MRIFIIAFLVLLTLQSCAKPVDIADFEKQIFDLTNQERAAHGLPALIYEPGLADLARLQSRNMFEHSFFAHQDQEGLEVAGRRAKYYPALLDCTIGENLFKMLQGNKRFDPQEVVTGWMNSPGHRANILNPEFTHIGVGVVVSGTELWATQNFATPSVKLLHELPISSTADRVVLRFEYLSTDSKEGFEAVIIYPDPAKKYFINENTYTLGKQPQSLVWTDTTHFTVEVPFVAGRGMYSLSFGWGNSFAESGYRIEAK